MFFKLWPKFNFATILLSTIIDKYKMCMVWVKCCCILLQRILWLVVYCLAVLQPKQSVIYSAFHLLLKHLKYTLHQISHKIWVFAVKLRQSKLLANLRAVVYHFWRRLPLICRHSRWQKYWGCLRVPRVATCPSRICWHVPDWCHAVLHPSKTRPGMPNVLDFQLK